MTGGPADGGGPAGTPAGGATPVASVGGATNALTFTTDTLRDVTIIGPGAGREETGQALLSDMLAIAGAERHGARFSVKAG